MEGGKEREGECVCVYLLELADKSIQLHNLGEIANWN